MGLAALFFFCYNDYRTHVGDRGIGVAKQRVHGVVDLYGRRKPSFENLRTESSSIERIVLTNQKQALTMRIVTRASLPAYTLRGYCLRAVFYGAGNIPVERQCLPLPELGPGQQHEVTLNFGAAAPVSIGLDILRPTGYSAASMEWKL